MQNLSERLNALLAKKQMNQAELADSLDVSRQAVSFWCIGRSEPKGTNLAKLANFFGVSPSWLQTGKKTEKSERVEPVAEEDPYVPDDCIVVPEFRLRFHASPEGAGGIPDWEEIHESRPAYYRLEFFQHLGVNPEKCRRIRVYGDSMEPVLYDGDRVLFEEASYPVHIIDGKVYAISTWGELRLKRLYRKANGDVILHSDNKIYPEETITREEMKDEDCFRIFGRVIEKAGYGGL